MGKLPSDSGKGTGGVGPGRPPVEHQFRKGVSGNPKGRPRKERDLAKLIEAELDREINVTEGGNQRKITKREALATGMVNDALQGNDKARAMLIKLKSQSGASDSDAVEIDEAQVLSYLRRQTGQTKGLE